LNSKYLYLTLNLLSFIVPFLFSFYPKANFSKKWKYVFPAMLITAILFILWDELFTQMKIWGFNSKYLSGLYFISLPLEEVLFFFCIPYACVFTYFALNYLIQQDYLAFAHKSISSILIVFLIITGCINLDKWYTSVTFISTAFFLMYLLFNLKAAFMGRFYLAFLFILIPFFIVNGILTGSFIDEPIVWYNNEENLNIRLGTIPVEDVFYGMLLILMNITIAERLEKNSLTKKNYSP
jgi:lycopene cyclase domain-containing protein